MGLQQLLEDLLGLNSYIQVNKTLIQKFGLHEAILISELYSERQYWRSQNVLRDNKWFFSTRENLEFNTGLTPYYQRDAISNLIDKGILECKLMDTPAKKYYAIVDDALLKALTSCDEDVSQQDVKAFDDKPLKPLTACCETGLQQDIKGFNDINKNNKKEINIKNNKKSTGTGAPAKNHSNIYKKQETLNDDLQSGKDIDEQKKVRKKTSEYDKCLVELDKRYDDPNIYAVLLNHLEWSYHSNDPKRIKSVKTYIKRLDELDALTGDKEKIIQQSIDKKWHCFYEYKETKSSKPHECFTESIHSTPIEEARKAMAEKKAKGVKIY